jgi:hypothetical protein
MKMNVCSVAVSITNEGKWAKTKMYQKLFMWWFSKVYYVCVGLINTLYQEVVLSCDPCSSSCVSVHDPEVLHVSYIHCITFT